MIIYFLYLVVAILLPFLVSNKDKQSKILCFLLFLIMALRAPSVGSDVSHYLDVYNEQLYFENVWEQFEFGYFAFSKLLYNIGLSDQMFLVVISAFTCISIYLFFKKYVDHPSFAWLLHVTMGLFVFNMTGLRQTIAICILLYSIDFILKKKIIYFIFLVLLAASFHKTALFFGIAYVFPYVQISSFKRVGLIVLLSFILILIRSNLVLFVSAFSADKYVNSYGVVNTKHQLNFLLYIINYCIFLFIPIVSYIQKTKLNEYSKNFNFFFVMSSIPMLMTGLIMNSAMISRLTYYFVFGYIVAISNSIGYLKLRDNRIIIGFLIISIVCLYFYIGNTDGIFKIDNYKFFFQK